MAARSMLMSGGLILLGIVILAAGVVIEPPRPQISQTGESLIAFGLTLIAIGLGFLFAWAAPTS